MDLAEAHVSSVKYTLSHIGYNTFNIGTGHGNSVLELIRSFESVTDQKVPYSIGARRPGDIVKIWADTNKAKNELGWQTTRSLDDSMRDAWRWQQSLK
jgi:UDP-glucose 4-epimerase